MRRWYDALVNASVVDQAILNTLAYAQVFGSALSKSLLYTRLHTSIPIPRTVFNQRLDFLLYQKKMAESQGYLSIPHQVDINAVIARRHESERKKNLFRSHLTLLTWIPTIQAIAITGSVAVDNAKREEDIDLFFVTTAGFLWTTRFLVSILVWFSGHLRRRYDKHVRNKWCLNLWLDTTSLLIPTQNLYIAHEIVQAQWVVDKQGIAAFFLSENRWIDQFLANTSIGKKKALQFSHDEQTIMWDFLKIVWSPLESLCFFLQDIHSRPGRTKEQIERHRALFHPRDTGAVVMRKYGHFSKKEHG